MRILITINTSWNIYNFRSGLVKALINEGHEVIAIAPRDNYSEKLNELGCKYFPIEMENTGVNPLKDLQLYFELKRIYGKIKPNIILQFTVKPNIYGSLAAQSLNIPVINNVSGLGTVFLSNSFSSIVAKWLYRLSFQKVPLVFFQNEEDKNDFIDELSIKDLNYDILPGSGVDLEFYKSSSTNQSLSPFVFLMIARVIIEKGIYEFVEAAKIIKQSNPKVEFHLLGQVDEKHKRGISISRIETWESEGAIEYLGESDDVKRIIEASSCVVLPSYREGTPRTLLEAAAMSKPIITTDVPGCKEVVIDGQNGYLCKVRDAKNLADKMKLMLQKKPLDLLQMGIKGRKIVEDRFDEQIVIKKYIKQISNIMNQNSL